MNTPSAPIAALDEAVMRATQDLAQRNTPAPDVLFFLGTGVGMLPTALKSPLRLPLGKLDGVPDAWKDVMLHAGAFGKLHAWLIEDAPGPQEHGISETPGEAAWVRGFPCWLAARAGAKLCVHTSAGQALPDTAASGAGAPTTEPPSAGSIAIVRDHLNLSGRTPLLGIGASTLGPLFPDQTTLHHAGLRAAALRRGKKLGVPLSEVVACCAPAPAIETPAERIFWARAGAQVAVQGLATPLLACAHAGLPVLALVAVTDAGTGLQRVGDLVAQADKLAPALEELITSLAPDLAQAAAELADEA